MGRLALLFFASGVAALALETVWLRWLRLLLGATAPAASATLAAFFTGSALGAAWAARRASHWRAPLRVYGVLELAAAACALLVPLGLHAAELALGPAYDTLRAAPDALTALRYAAALLATLPAAFCFGATLPAVGAAALARADRPGSVGAGLYAWNTLGATLGAALTAFLLIETLGVPASYGLATGLSAAVGLAALALARRDPGSPGPPRRTRARAGPSETRKALLAVAALSGLGALAVQVLLVHAFARILDQSVHSFGAVVAVVLVTAAGAAALVAELERRGAADPRTLLGAGLALGALALAAFPAWLERVTGGFAYVGAARPGWPHVAAALGTVSLAAGPALLAISLVLPATFAWSGRRASAGPEGAGAGGAALGRLLAANTLGALAGALAAPWWLLPGLGLWPSFLGLSALYALAAAWVPGSGRMLRLAVLGAGGLAVLAFASPLGVEAVRLRPGERLVHARATPAGLVAVIEREGERALRIDEHYVLGGSAERAHEERQGHLPLLLHAAPRRVAFVGTATGISAGAALAHPVERVHLVELVPEAARAGERFFAAWNRGVYAEPRARVVLDDARNYLRATHDRFHVVMADLFVPWRAGTGALYAREHFRAVRARLEPDGLFCQWLPLYQLSEAEVRILVATFLDVFPRAAVFRGDFYGRFPIAALVGWKGEPPPAARVSEAARAVAARGETDRWIADPVGVWALYLAPLAPSADVFSGAPRNSDAHPRLEFLAARGHAGGLVGKQRPFVGLDWVRFAEALRSATERAGDPLFPRLTAEARRASAGGAALQLAGALFVSGRREEASRAFTHAARLLPERLVAAAPADASAAELWAAGD